MFILRKITGNGVEENLSLGDSYRIILKESNPKAFNDILEIGGNAAFKDDLYGFICHDLRYERLFIDDFNYIMTENGKTFKNITHHDKMHSRDVELAESQKHFEAIQKLHKGSRK